MAIDCYIKFDGVDGEATQANHKGEIEVLSFSYGLTNASSAGSGGGSGKGKAEPHALSFVHHYDKASPVLKKHAASGKHFDKVVLSVEKAGEGQQTFKTITMKQAFITDVRITASAGGDLIETVSLSYTDIEVEYKPQTEKGGLGGAIKFGWNLSEAKTR